jgi:hypothetical protein
MKLSDLLPWKRKGYKVLDKYDVNKPEDADKLVLQQMVDRGADLTKERHVIHYIYFPDDVSRAAAEHSFQQANYQTRHGRDYGDARPKSLIAERTGLVNTEIVAKERALITSIAEANDGDYDGWEAALD